MAEASIPVDLLNPGQVFACLGFVEAAIALLGDAEGAFDWREQTVRFHLRAPGARSPVVELHASEASRSSPSRIAHGAWHRGDEVGARSVDSSRFRS